MTLADILRRPVPDFSVAREAKDNYRKYALLTIGSRDDEPLVDIAGYGIAGQSYYSRPNGATGEPVPGVSRAVLVRKSIAERLSRINYELQRSDEVQELLAGKVELFINEGLRSVALQKKLYDQIFPELVRAEHPVWTTAQVNERRDELIARPPKHGESPSPHATGAAVDVRLRFAQAEPGYVAGSEVYMGTSKAETGLITLPDYFEHHKPSNKKDKAARQNRRIFYWIMRGALLGDDSGFVVNPTEWWHWSYGDQLWAQLTGAPEAFFSFAKT